jgi:hypothetical protein
MNGEPVIVVVEGGCVSDVLGVHSYDVFDWDNFKDNPVAYWEENGGDDSEYFGTIKDLSPTLFDEIKQKVDDARREMEAERHKDPFCDVESK